MWGPPGSSNCVTAPVYKLLGQLSAPGHLSSHGQDSGDPDPGLARGHVSCVGPCTGDSAGFNALTCHLELLNELSRGPVFSLHTES